MSVFIDNLLNVLTAKAAQGKMQNYRKPQEYQILNLSVEQTKNTEYQKYALKNTRL